MDRAGYLENIHEEDHQLVPKPNRLRGDGQRSDGNQLGIPRATLENAADAA